MTYHKQQKRTHCANCGLIIEPGKEYRNAGKVFHSRLCQEFDALREIEKHAGKAFAPMF